MNFGGYFVALTMAALISTAPVKTEDVNWRNLDNVAIEEFEARTGYITGSVNLRSLPDISGESMRVLKKGTTVTVIAVSTGNPYNSNTYYITEDGGFIHSVYNIYGTCDRF
ncbi:MAG: SH3 domain-containing protein [Lachnospiraceae bacterium]|nr:SH3 domain-containing protein [Lachnospiraceae bacterium]